MSLETIATAAYVVAAILFILALAGLSKHETSRAGNTFGIGGMAVPAGIGASHHLHADLERPLDARDVMLQQRLGTLADMRLRRSAVVFVDQ